MMFGFGGGACVWGVLWQMSSYALSGGRKGIDTNVSFLCLVQYETIGNCSSLCCKDFLVTFEL